MINGATLPYSWSIICTGMHFRAWWSRIKSSALSYRRCIHAFCEQCLLHPCVSHASRSLYALHSESLVRVGTFDGSYYMHRRTILALSTFLRFFSINNLTYICLCTWQYSPSIFQYLHGVQTFRLRNLVSLEQPSRSKIIDSKWTLTTTSLPFHRPSDLPWILSEVVSSMNGWRNASMFLGPFFCFVELLMNIKGNTLSIFKHMNRLRGVTISMNSQNEHAVALNHCTLSPLWLMVI